MKQIDKTTFHELIGDADFIRWANGSLVEKPEKWKNYQTTTNEQKQAFDEAVKAVKLLSFANPKVSDLEITYLKNKLLGRSNKEDQHSTKKKILFTLRNIAAILAIPLLIFSTWTLSQGYLGFNSKNQQVHQNITVDAPIGSRVLVDLPDGSKVWLNSGSQLTYPTFFASGERRVRLEGEAFFQIESDKNPFYVDNFGPPVKVYGTEFNVKSYVNEEFVIVALVKGSIALETNDSEKFLKPGQVAFYDIRKHSIVVETKDLELFVSWREGKFIFRNATLDSILRVLQRQYNVNFSLSEPELGSYRYNAIFHNESLEQIIQLLEISAPIKFDYIKGTMSDSLGYTESEVRISKK